MDISWEAMIPPYSKIYLGLSVLLTTICYLPAVNLVRIVL